MCHKSAYFADKLAATNFESAVHVCDIFVTEPLCKYMSSLYQSQNETSIRGHYHIYSILYVRGGREWNWVLGLSPSVLGGGTSLVALECPLVRGSNRTCEYQNPEALDGITRPMHLPSAGYGMVFQLVLLGVLTKCISQHNLPLCLHVQLLNLLCLWLMYASIL